MKAGVSDHEKEVLMKTKRFHASLNDNCLFTALKIEMRLLWV
jgi:hypothetical protein